MEALLKEERDILARISALDGERKKLLEKHGAIVEQKYTLKTAAAAKAHNSTNQEISALLRESKVEQIRSFLGQAPESGAQRGKSAAMPKKTGE